MPRRRPPPVDLPLVRICGEEVPFAGHICAFFDSPEQKYDTIGPYFNDAIGAGDCVINVVPTADRDAHVESLRAAQVPVDLALEMDRLRLLTVEETYLRDGEPTLDSVIEMVRETMRSTESEGRCVRTCGEMDWIARAPTAVSRVMEYEAKVNHLLNHQCTLLCVYNTGTTPSAIVADIMATHPWAIVNGRLRRNENYVEPEAYLAMLRARA